MADFCPYCTINTSGSHEFHCVMAHPAVAYMEHNMEIIDDAVVKKDNFIVECEEEIKQLKIAFNKFAGHTADCASHESEWIDDDGRKHLQPRKCNCGLVEAQERWK